MSLLNSIADKLNVIHKVKSVPTKQSRAGLYFVHADDGRKAVYIVSRSNLFRIFDSEYYKTKEEINDDLGKKANASTVEAHGKKIDILATTKVDNERFEALMNGINKRDAVDTYSNPPAGKTSLLGTYPNPQVGWDVYVRDENTRYNWNGSKWVNMETGIYDENAVTKEELSNNPTGASGKHNGSDSFFIIPYNKICIKKTGFRVMSRQGITYRVNMTNSEGQIGSDKIFGWDDTIVGTSGQYLVLDTTLFVNKQSWIDTEGLMKMIGDSELSEDHIVLASWYEKVLDENIGIIGNAIINTNYNEKVSVIPYLNNKFSFYFNDAPNTPTENKGEVSLSVGSFIILYRGVSYKIRMVDAGNNETTFKLSNTFGTSGSANKFLTSFELDLSALLLDMSTNKDSEGFRYVEVKESTFSKYFKVSNSLSTTLQEQKTSGMFRLNDNLILLSMYRREPIGGVLLPYYSRYNIVNFRDRQYYVMANFNIYNTTGIKLQGFKLWISHLMAYCSDWGTRKTSYYQMYAETPIEIELKDGDCVIVDFDKLAKNTISKISLERKDEQGNIISPTDGSKAAIRVVQYGDYTNDQLPIVMRRTSFVYEYPPFTSILTKGKIDEVTSLTDMYVVTSQPTGIQVDGSTISFEDATFVYLKNQTATTDYIRLNPDSVTSPHVFNLDQGKTLVIDTTKVTKNNDSSTVNGLSEVLKIIDYGKYRLTDIPIAHYRRGKMFLSSIFYPVVGNLSGNTAVYDINVSEFLPLYQSISQMKNSSYQWINRLNLLHISDIHIGSEDADINLREAIKLAKEPNIGLSAIIGTGDLTVGYQGAVAKQNTLLQLKMCSEIVNGSPVIPLMQLGNHDPNDADRVKATAVAKAEQWNNMFAPISNKWTNIVWGDRENNRHYHYYDITHDLGNVRVIMLDQLDHDLPTGADGKLIYSCQEDAVFSQKQIDWLCNEALRVPDGYGVILCNHFGFMERGTIDTSLLLDGQFVQGWRLVPDIVQAWQNKTTLNKNYTDIRSNTQPIKVNVDFSAIGANTEFICYLCGHTHYRTHQPVNGYKQLLIMEDSSGQRGNIFSKFVRIKKSPTSNAFSLLSIDRSEKSIYRTSYGAYKNYDETTGNRIEVINYKI